MNTRESLLRFLDKDFRKLVKYLKTETDIDLTKFKYGSWNKIKKYINKDVRSIKIDFTEEIRRDLYYFRTLPNLESIDFGEKVCFNEKYLDILSEIGIKEITVGDMLINYDNASRDVATIASLDETVMYYNGVIVNVKSHNTTLKSNQLVIESYSFNDELMSKLLSKMDTTQVEEIKINADLNNQNSYEIKRKGKIIENLVIKGYDLSEVERFYNYLTYSGYTVKNVDIKEKNCSLKDVGKLLCLFNNETLESAKIVCFGKDLSVDASLENNKVSVKIEVNSLDEVKSLISNLSRNDVTINNLTINISNFLERYNEEFDMEYLRNISKKLNLKIDYGMYTCSYEEWCGLFESVKWYRELITSYDLSPAEKVMYVHDLMKSIPYIHPKQDGGLGRAPHLVMSTEFAVCGGYANMFCEIINGIDPKIGASYSSFKKKHHACVLVRIDDDKYNIHGIFELDPTVDGQVYSKVKDIYGFDTDTRIDLYQAFLVPLSEHVKIYGDPELPLVIQTYLNIINDKGNEVSELDGYKMFFAMKKLFGENVSGDKIYSYLKVNRPSLSDFKNMLLNVREAQGFSHEEALREVERIVQFNIDYVNYLNEVSNSPKEIESHFFEDTITRNH